MRLEGVCAVSQRAMKDAIANRLQGGTPERIKRTAFLGTPHEHREWESKPRGRPNVMVLLHSGAVCAFQAVEARSNSVRHLARSIQLLRARLGLSSHANFIQVKAYAGFLP